MEGKWSLPSARPVVRVVRQYVRESVVVRSGWGHTFSSHPRVTENSGMELFSAFQLHNLAGAPRLNPASGRMRAWQVHHRLSSKRLISAGDA